MNKFGKKIKEYRKDIKKISIRKFANAVGISPTYLGQIEDGKCNPPRAEIIDKMADELGIDRNELLNIANSELEKTGKSESLQDVRVPYSDKVPGFLRSISKYVKNPEDWDDLAKEIKEKKEKGLDESSN